MRVSNIHNPNNRDSNPNKTTFGIDQCTEKLIESIFKEGKLSKDLMFQELFVKALIKQSLLTACCQQQLVWYPAFCYLKWKIIFNNNIVTHRCQA